jgi:hypothetical protein
MIMGILSSIFSNDSDSSNSSDLVGDLNAALGINAVSETSYESVDEDGNSVSYDNATGFGTDVDLDGILSTMTDGMFSGDSDAGFAG